MTKIKSFFKLILVFGLVFMIAFGFGASIHNLLLAGDKNESEEAATIKDGQRTNILLLGIDARPGEKQTRSDTIILASIDPELNKKRGQELVISTPDSRVKLMVIPTNEELVIARDTRDILQGK
jgi:anionic cell wall polymer biosynthesis LytR-Cps2A-Psr (LCP) family protein